MLFSKDGQIKSGPTSLATAAPGSWTHVEISFPLDGAAREARVAVTLADGSQKTARLALSPEFAAVTSLGFFCSDAVDGRCSLDNLRMTVTP